MGLETWSQEARGRTAGWFQVGHRPTLPLVPRAPLVLGNLTPFLTCALSCRDMEANGRIWAMHWRLRWVLQVLSTPGNPLHLLASASVSKQFFPQSQALGLLEFPHFSKLASPEEKALRGCSCSSPPDLSHVQPPF